MVLSRPDFVKNCATIATSPNQEGREGTHSEEIWMCTDVCVILRLYPPYADRFFFFLLRRHTFVFFTSIFPFLPIHALTLPACSQLVAHPVGISLVCSSFLLSLCQMWVRIRPRRPGGFWLDKLKLVTRERRSFMADQVYLPQLAIGEDDSPGPDDPRPEE